MLKFLLLIPFENSRANNHNRKAETRECRIGAFHSVFHRGTFESRLLPARQQVAQEIANFAKVKRSRASRLRSIALSKDNREMYIEIFLYLFQKRQTYIYTIIFYITIIGAMM